MRSNSNWPFESPLPKPPQFCSPYPHRHAVQPQPDQSQWSKPILLSPDPQHPFQFNRQEGLTPWTKGIHHQYKQSPLVIDGLAHEHLEHQGIHQRLEYSGDQYEEEEGEDPVTPVKESYYKGAVQEGEVHTTGRKSEFQLNKKSKPKEKGLRKLSQRAFEIVQQMKFATYKEVAGKLVIQMNDEQEDNGVQQIVENKEEQNIKRRVYDALNVLIALGVLKKDGRRIVSDRVLNKTGRGCERPEEYDNLKAKLQAKKSSILQKRRKLRQAKQKMRCIQILMRRNMQAINNNEAIPFPFIGMMLPKQIEEVRHENEEEFVIKTREPLQPFGDIDSLKWLLGSLEKLGLGKEEEEEEEDEKEGERYKQQEEKYEEEEEEEEYQSHEGRYE